MWKQYSAALEKSSYDYLSGIYNRSALMKYGEGMLQRADQEKHSIGALMIDIDDFKRLMTAMDICREIALSARLRIF